MTSYSLSCGPFLTTEGCSLSSDLVHSKGTPLPFDFNASFKPLM